MSRFSILDQISLPDNSFDSLNELSENELKNIAFRYKLFAEASLDPIVIHQNGKIIFTNLMVRDLFGYSSKDVINKPLTIFVALSVLDIFMESIEMGLDEFESLGLTKDGRTVTLEIHNIELKASEGQAYGVLILRDITRRKNVENRLFRTEQEYKKLFEDSKDAIYISSKEGRILDVNKSALDLFEYTKTQMLQLDTKTLYKNPDDRQQFIEEIEKFGAIRDFEVKLKRKSGDLVDCLITSSVRIDKSGNVIGFQGIIRDITSLKKTAQLMRAKELAEKSAEMKSKFLANMSHEIRTPLNAVFGLTNLLMNSPLNEQQRHYIDVIQSSTDHLLVLINDILDLSKIEAGKLNIEAIEFSLTELMDNIESSAQFKVTQKAIDFNINISQHVPEFLIGDSVRLNQILYNLISNAIKFTIEGSVRITIKLLEEKESFVRLYFEVNDTGIGISKEMQQDIFSTFTQGNYDTTRKFGGTGLGLTITKKLVEMQGGGIAVKSELGIGSTFSFTLKFIKSSGEEFLKQKEENKMFQIRDLGNLHILLVEDNKVNQFVTSETIKNWGTGLQIDLAENGEIGLEMIQKNNYDLIIMDIQMPVMDGYTATKKLRKEFNPPKSVLPVLAMTAFATPGEAEKCLHAGMDDYIPKPFNPTNLYNKIAELTHRKGGDIIEFKSETESGKEEKTQMQQVGIDLKYLNTVTHGNEALRSDMIQVILDETPGEVQRMIKLLENKQWYALGAAAHKIKSTATFIGNRFLEKALKTLELNAKQEKHLNSIPEMVKDIDSNFKESLKMLEDFLETEEKNLS